MVTAVASFLVLSFVVMTGAARADLTPVEQGVPAAPWIESTLRGRELVERSGPDGGPHDGNWQVKLCGSNSEHDVISQTVILPVGAASANLSFWYSIKATGNSQDDAPLDSFFVEIPDIDGKHLRVLRSFTSADQTSQWTQSPSLPLDDFIGQVIVVTFNATTNKTKPTFFFLDDVSLTFLPTNVHTMSFAYVIPRTGCLLGGGDFKKRFLSGIVPVEVLAASSDGVSSLSLTLDGQMIGTTSSSQLIVDVDTSTLSPGEHMLEAQATSTLGITSTCPAPITPLPLLRNGDFEEDLASPSAMWFKDDVMTSTNSPVFAAGSLLPAYSGSHVARFGGVANTANSLNQLISFPLQGGIATITFYARVYSDRTTTQDVDHLTVSITNPYGGADPVSLVTLSNLNRSPLALSTGGGFTLYRFDIDLAATGLAGTIGQLSFNSQTAGGNGTTSFFVDAVGFTVTAPPDPATTSVIVRKPMADNLASGTSPFIPVDLPTLKLFGAGIVSEYESYYVAKVATANLSSFVSSASNYYVEPSPDFDRVRVNGYDFASGSTPTGLPTNLTIDDYSSATGLYLVQLAGPARWEWEAALRSVGSSVEYLSENSYIVRASPSRAQFLGYRPFVRSATVYQPAYKVLNGLLSESGAFQILVELDGGIDLTNARAILESINGGPIFYENTGPFRTTALTISPFDLPTIASLPEVLWIERPIGPELSDEGIALSVAGKVTNNGKLPTSPGTYQNWLNAAPTATPPGLGFCTPSCPNGAATPGCPSYPNVTSCFDYRPFAQVAMFDSGIDINYCGQYDEFCASALSGPPAGTTCNTTTCSWTKTIYKTYPNDFSISTFNRHPDLCNLKQNHQIKFDCMKDPGRTPQNLCQGGTNGTFFYGDYCAHGTATASILAGDPNAGTGLAYTTCVGSDCTEKGFYFGSGVAPSADILEFKINGFVTSDTATASCTRTFDPTPDHWQSYYKSVCGGSGLNQPCNTGIRFANNSWNNYPKQGVTPVPADIWAYTAYSKKFDQLVRNCGETNDLAKPMVIVFAAGNIDQANLRASDGQRNTDKTTWTQYVVAPATAKNVISAGSADGYRSITTDPDFSDQVLCGPADGFTNVYDASGQGVQAVQGQTGASGRYKPDLLAPTTRESVAFTRRFVSAFGTNSCVSKPRIISGSTSYYEGGMYTRFPATSGAAPAVTGAAVLLRAWMIRNLGSSHDPSPAMIKAILTAHAADIQGGSASDFTRGSYFSYPGHTATKLPFRPNPEEGWGRVELASYPGADTPIAPSMFDSTVASSFFDEDHATTPTRRFVKSSATSLKTWSKYFVVQDPSKEVLIALAWTDAPGTENSANPAVNNLDLRLVDSNPVSSTSKILAASQPVYRQGNRMTGGYSIAYTTIPSPDVVNNVEIIRVGVGGIINNDFYLNVTPTSVTMPGVPGLDGSYPNQDWALYVYNAR